jgi:hypothetical protein
MDTQSYNIRMPKRWVRIAMIVGATALIVAPLTAVATHTFNDVPDSHTFHGDIEWLEAAGVTKGCNPPANTQYCPDDDVTRGQMSAFMRRLAENRVVDADKVDGKDASVLAGVTAAQGYDWFAGAGNVDLSATGTVIAETSIAAPAAGHLILIGNATVGNSPTAGSFYTIWIEVDEGTCGLDGTGVPSNGVNGATTLVADGTADDYSAGVSGVAQVSEGDHTVTLCGANDASDGDAFHSSVIAQYTSEGSVSAVTSSASAGDGAGADG